MFCLTLALNQARTLRSPTCLNTIIYWRTSSWQGCRSIRAFNTSQSFSWAIPAKPTLSAFTSSKWNCRAKWTTCKGSLVCKSIGIWGVAFFNLEKVLHWLRPEIPQLYTCDNLAIFTVFKQMITVSTCWTKEACASAVTISIWANSPVFTGIGITRICNGQTKATFGYSWLKFRTELCVVCTRRRIATFKCISVPKTGILPLYMVFWPVLTWQFCIVEWNGISHDL